MRYPDGVAWTRRSGQGLRPPKGRTWGHRGQTPVVKVTGGHDTSSPAARSCWSGTGWTPVPAGRCASWSRPGLA